MLTVNPNVIPTLRKTKDADSTKPLDFVPVNYMSPWMFIPTYLEVCYATCSTVFLRSPLAQPNTMEIPSPFPPTWHQLVFEWYASIKRSQTKRQILPQLVVGGRSVTLKPKFDTIVRADNERKQKMVLEKRRQNAARRLATQKKAYESSMSH
jgi:hypothetical protein